VDGEAAETFLHCAKTSSGVEAMGRDAAVLTSLCLQFGCPIETLRSAVTREEDGRPASLVGALLDAAVEEISATEVRFEP
jgi:hypothetical protein